MEVATFTATSLSMELVRANQVHLHGHHPGTRRFHLHGGEKVRTALLAYYLVETNQVQDPEGPLEPSCSMVWVLKVGPEDHPPLLHGGGRGGSGFPRDAGSQGDNGAFPWGTL